MYNKISRKTQENNGIKGISHSYSKFAALFAIVCYLMWIGEEDIIIVEKSTPLLKDREAMSEKRVRLERNSVLRQVGVVR